MMSNTYPILYTTVGHISYIYSDSRIVFKTINLSKLHFLWIEPCNGSSPDLEAFFLTFCFAKLAN